MEINLRSVSKVYGQRRVVQQVSVSVAQGEIVGLLGPNGAGKTTTFYIATGLVQPDEGYVCLGGKDITRIPIHRRARMGIAYLAQEPTIFRHLTVADNLLLVMEQTQVPRHSRLERLYRLLHEFRLEHVAGSLGIQVSGGERRRTEIARALAVGAEGPKFLLLDEPFAGVDPIAVAEIQEIMANLKQRHMGILITDHNVRETLAVIDRAYIMRDGEILASGNSQELSQNPQVRKYYLGERFHF
ncbi:MAG: LPS export ABC transporter ATP-binding protein [Cyanobacteria bacterium KgW148]|nr:LPS export ABC transporter ATP-binding protein [Cyanobacteria bacterium KgW148]